MSSDGEPFVLTLNKEEAAQITGFDIVGSGGLQSLLRRLRKKIDAGDDLEFDNRDLGQLIRYMTKHGDGGFETRLRRAFARSIIDLLRPVLKGEPYS